MISFSWNIIALLLHIIHATFSFSPLIIFSYFPITFFSILNDFWHLTILTISSSFIITTFFFRFIFFAFGRIFIVSMLTSFSIVFSQPILWLIMLVFSIWLAHFFAPSSFYKAMLFFFSSHHYLFSFWLYFTQLKYHFKLNPTCHPSNMQLLLRCTYIWCWPQLCPIWCLAKN